VQLTFSLYSISGLLIMLGIGLFILGIFQRWIYPHLRLRHEKAKMTGSHGLDPSMLTIIVKIFGLMIMPTLGFLFGNLLLSGLNG